MITHAQIESALTAVIDPDLRKDIVSLGFVKNIQIEAGVVAFDVELTTPACPVKDLLKQQCIEAVRQLDGVTEVRVNMTARVAAYHHPTLSRLGDIKHIVAVASGKGGVGKSTVALNLALSLVQAGASVGLLDADIYGPSIPKMLNITERPMVEDKTILPIEKFGLKIISMGMLADPEQPVIWRGPMLGGILQQFLDQVKWGALDYLIIDLPPGTGDVQLTLCQRAPLSGAVIVSTPQEVALLDTIKGLKMFQNLNVPILGIVENMSYFICDGCEKRHYIFRKGGARAAAEQLELPLLAEIPMDGAIADGGDLGEPIVIRETSSVAATAYQQLAGQIASKLSILNQSKPIPLPSLNMTWTQ